MKNRNASDEVIAIEVEPSTIIEQVNTTSTVSTSSTSKSKKKVPKLEPLTEVDMEEEGRVTAASTSFKSNKYGKRSRRNLQSQVKAESSQLDNKGDVYEERNKKRCLKEDRNMSKKDHLNKRAKIKKE